MGKLDRYCMPFAMMTWVYHTDHSKENPRLSGVVELEGFKPIFKTLVVTVGSEFL